MSNASTEQAEPHAPEVGAWVITCNPEHSKPEVALAKRGLDDFWSLPIGSLAPAAAMREGDAVVFYVDRGSSKVDAGFWGAGRIMDTVVRDVASDPGAWLDRPRADERTTWVRIAVTFWDMPVTLDQASDDAVLAGSTAVTEPQPAPVALTQAELDALLALAGRDDVDDGAGGVTSPYTASALGARVEKRAFKAALKHYKKFGFKPVDDVRDEPGLGYDLELKRKVEGVKETIRVEVRGKVGPDPSVSLTRRELKAAKKDKGWRLLVVTNVLEKESVVTELDGKAARKASSAEAHRVVLG